MTNTLSSKMFCINSRYKTHFQNTLSIHKTSLKTNRFRCKKYFERFSLPQVLISHFRKSSTASASTTKMSNYDLVARK